MTDATGADVRRLKMEQQSTDEAYAEPTNFLEIDLINPQIHGLGSKRYVTYELVMRSNLPVFRLKQSSVRRRYSDFEWLKKELERDSKIMVPKLPSKSLMKQIPLLNKDDGIFDEAFIEDRRVQLEKFANKIAGHPLAQMEKCLHMFLQDEVIDKNYTPGKVKK